MTRLTITGFGPFPGIPRNPSEAAARRAASSPRWRLHGVAAQALVLDTTWRALDEAWAPALATLSGDPILMIGVAGRARALRVERRALNRASLLSPDAERSRPQRLALPGRAFERRTTVPVVQVAVLLRRHGLRTAVSQNAGRYLCNASYYAALGHGAPVLFIHIPRRPRGAAGRLWLDRLSAALVEVGLRLVRRTLVRAAP